MEKILVRKSDRFMPRLVGFALVSALVLLSLPGEVQAGFCAAGKRPAATLLVPYFEVDTTSASGRTTLFSIGNASNEPVAAYVTLWSDWSIPVFGFFVHLGPSGLETINLRDVLRDLQVPSLDDVDGAAFPGCVEATPTPDLTAEQLRARLRGLPDPQSGLCFGRDRGETGLAVGFVTVDVASDCVADLESPRQWMEEGLAGAANVLFGEIFYIDTDQDSVQGINAVPIRDDPTVEVDRIDNFYPNDLTRVPPDERWRTRYIRGSGVDADTELIVWMGEFRAVAWDEGQLCDQGGYGVDIELQFRTAPESGTFAALQVLELDATTNRFEIETLLGDEAPDAAANGVLELEAWSTCGSCLVTPEPPIRMPSIVWPIVRADGRFSLAVEATPTAGSCLE